MRPETTCGLNGKGEEEERERMVVRELHLACFDVAMPLRWQLIDNQRKLKGLMTHQHQELSATIAAREATLSDTQQRFDDHVKAADDKESRLATEISRLCGVVEQLKSNMAAQAAEAANMHTDTVKTMSSQIGDLQVAPNQRPARARIKPCNQLLTNCQYNFSSPHDAAGDRGA